MRRIRGVRTLSVIVWALTLYVAAAPGAEKVNADWDGLVAKVDRHVAAAERLKEIHALGQTLPSDGASTHSEVLEELDRLAENPAMFENPALGKYYYTVREKFSISAADKIPAAGVSIPGHAAVKAYLNYFEGRGNRWLSRGSQRKGVYREIVEPILQEAGLPTQLSVLPLLESFYDPQALSSAGAKGLWQLMPETARRYGLRVDAVVDEREHAAKSTRAAAAYLKDLFNRFRDWPLALSAYNAGERRIESLLEATGASDFWELAKSRGLSRETRRYVPAFFALLQLFSPSESGRRSALLDSSRPGTGKTESKH